MKYRLLQPPEYLASHIQYVWVLENDSPGTLPLLNPLADGSPGLIFHQSTKRNFNSTTKGVLPPVFLYGQTVKPGEILLEGEFRSIGITFQPDSLGRLFGMNAGHLTDTCLNVRDEYAAVELEEALLNSASTDAQLSILYDYIYKLVQKRDTRPEPVTAEALNHILGVKGVVDLQELQKRLRVSERTLERKFTTQVGISPKLFSRVTQFQASLDQLKAGRFTRLSDIAFDNGYTDQSHFIRSFKTFTGFTPFQFQQKTEALAGTAAVLV